MGLVRFFLESDSHNKPSHNRGAEVNAEPRKDYASNLQLPLGRLRLAVRQVVNYEVPLPHTGIPLQSARGRRAILGCPVSFPYPSRKLVTADDAALAEGLRRFVDEKKSFPAVIAMESWELLALLALPQDAGDQIHRQNRFFVSSIFFPFFPSLGMC